MKQALVMLAITTAAGIFNAIRRQRFAQPRHGRAGGGTS